MKVFGIGLNKTGTSTLGVCLRTLGYRHTSHSLDRTRDWARRDLAPIFAVADQYESFEDWPWPLLYRELDERYPGSRFILTTRSSARVWYRSLRKHADRTGPTEFRELVYGHPMPHGHRREHIEFYRRHNDAVRSYFEGREDDFLEVCWEKGSGWDELCGFLGRPVPDVLFPHANRSPDRSADFWQKATRRSARLFSRLAAR